MQRQEANDAQVLRQQQVAIGLNALRHKRFDPDQFIPKPTDRQEVFPNRLKTLKPVQKNQQRTEPRGLSEFKVFHQLHHETRHELDHSAGLAGQGVKNRRVMIDQPHHLFQALLGNMDIENPDHDHGHQQAAVFISSQKRIHEL